AGADHQRRERRPLHARHRPLAQDRDRGHVRPLLRAPRAPHGGVPRRADAAAARRGGGLEGRGVPPARADRRARRPPGGAAGRGGGGEVAGAGGGGVGVLGAGVGAALLRLTGRYADGTITWMTGVKTLASHTVPALRRAAEEAGRPAPRIVAGLPIALVHDA